jgi:inosine/xanthosine triphosphatase
MNISVGSKNVTKVKAVQDTVALYPVLFPEPLVTGMDVEVGLFHHPKNIEETVRGAIERAKKSFVNCTYSFGLEGGLFEVPYSKSGYMEIGACAIFDGKNTYLGLSPAFEWPEKVTQLITADLADASQAFNQLGLTEQVKLGAQEGGILGLLTGGRLTREDQTKYSIIMALIQLEKPEYFIS